MPEQSIAAGVVVFQPESDRLLELVDAIASEVGLIALFLNSKLDADLRDSLSRREHVSFIEAEINLGVGVALNIIALTASLAGFELVILFDQDSQPQPGMVGRLLEVQTALRTHGHNPAVVAPLLISADVAVSKPPTYRYRFQPKLDGRVSAVDFAPTSGSLIRLDAWRAVGTFRSDYFIDGIDLEWSFRAWSRGYSCWIAPGCPMLHTIGSGVISLPLFRFRMPVQRSFRMYCLVRNTLYGLRLAHIPLLWKVKQLAYLPLQVLSYWRYHGFDRDILRVLMTGIWAGLHGRLGIPRGAPASASSSIKLVRER